MSFLSTHLDKKDFAFEKETNMLGETKQNNNVLLLDYKLNQYLILGFCSTFSQH